MRTPARLPQNIESSPRGVCEESGAKITQLTSAAFISTNIYPESPIFTPDSKRFVFARFQSTSGPKEFWLCDLTNHRIRRLTDEGAVSGPVVTSDGGWMLYMCELDEYELELRRISLDTFERETVCAMSDHRWPYSLGTISPDDRWYATGVNLGDPKRWGVLLVDIEERSSQILNEDPFICNPHMHISPKDGRTVLVQHNRGCEIDEDGKAIRSTGEIGATLYVVDRETGDVSTMKIGKPHTDRIQGHQSWIGDTGRIICTLGSGIEKAEEEGNLITMTPGDEAPSLLAKGYYYCHPNASRDGKWFVSDIRPGDEIIIGSMTTGKTRVLCHSESSFGRPQYTHPHPFFTPDGKHVLFNSDRTGLGQVYIATVPEEVLKELDE